MVRKPSPLEAYSLVENTSINQVTTQTNGKLQI